MPGHEGPIFVPNTPSGSNEATKDSVSAALPSAAASLVDSGQPLPARIGRYRIIRLLGEGGMGAVYEAEQDFPHRTVALKVIRAGYATLDMLRRFENEAQALGRLQHPGIAQIYEAGTAETPFGKQPYFAMELVRGQALVAYCDEHQLDVRQRLELMTKICDAVQHAHQRALIHRDLKPANILVDESGQPRILDFGVARLTDSDAQATRQTDIGQLVGTLAYMSPEQVLGDPAEIDTRSDVYALGVILYELLAGKGPYVMGRQLHEVVRTIREEEPTALSSVNRTYRGDVDTIAGKALEKDKTRRYASAAELAADIRRYLHDEPITARPPSTSYQLWKFARRNRALVLGVAAVFVVLVLGVVASTWEAVQARRAEAKAKQESAIAQAVNDFLQNDLLGQASAYNQSKPDPDITVRTVLDRAAQRIQGKFGKQPEVEAAIRDTIGQTYMDLGLYAEARTQLERALDLRRRVLGTRSPEALKAMSRLGRIADLQGRYPEAEVLLAQSLANQRRVLGSQHSDTLYSMNNLADVYGDQGKYPQAEALLAQALEIRRRILGPEHSDTLNSMNSLANVYTAEGKYPPAEALQRQALETQRRVLGPEHPSTLISMNNLANVYVHQGKYPQAEALFVQTLEIQRRVLGPEHPYTLMSMGNLASVYGQEGKYAQGEALDVEVLEIRRRVLGTDHPETLLSMDDLAAAYGNEGKYEQAAALLSQLLEIRRRMLGPEHSSAVFSMDNLAYVYSELGRYALAEALLNQALGIARRVLDPEHPSTLYTLSDFAWMYQQRGKYALAETYAAQALAGRRHALGPDHPDTMASEADLALAYVSENRFARSEPLAREALETETKVQPDNWQRFRAESLLGASLAGEKKYAEAEPLLLEGYQGMLARKNVIDVPDRYHMKLAHRWIVQLYQAWGKPDKATQWKKKYVLR
ncbi:MAG TPA: tetratricopeptide repeat protein [Terriglobia bacterium]|nr:tetratricopeptide repeat protein [Terriglobia bacterium]